MLRRTSTRNAYSHLGHIIVSRNEVNSHNAFVNQLNDLIIHRNRLGHTRLIRDILEMERAAKDRPECIDSPDSRVGPLHLFKLYRISADATNMRSSPS